MVSTSSSTLTKKKTQGRRKIEIKKIEKPNQLQVTFSKRRTGLFKKAGDLCSLTGAQIAVLVTSPANKLFAFGHSSVDSVVDRYLTGTTTDTAPNRSLADFNSQHTEITAELEAEERRREKIEEERERGFWWRDVCVEELGVEELEKYMVALEELKSKVLMRADELEMIKGLYFDGDDEFHMADDELEMINGYF